MFEIKQKNWYNIKTYSGLEKPGPSRQPHKLKLPGSNPGPATTKIQQAESRRSRTEKSQQQSILAEGNPVERFEGNDKPSKTVGGSLTRVASRLVKFEREMKMKNTNSTRPTNPRPALSGRREEV